MVLDIENGIRADGPLAEGHLNGERLAGADEAIDGGLPGAIHQTKAQQASVDDAVVHVDRILHQSIKDRVVVLVVG